MLNWQYLYMHYQQIRYLHAPGVKTDTTYHHKIIMQTHNLELNSKNNITPKCYKHEVQIGQNARLLLFNTTQRVASG